MASKKQLPDLSQPETLLALSPGDMARLSPAQRVALAKRTKKGQTPGPALTLPPTVQSG